MTSEPLDRTKWAQLVARVWSDDALKARLFKEPASVLHEHGIDVPVGLEVRVVENTDKVAYLMLPPRPAGEATELSVSQLDAVSGGYCLCLVTPKDCMTDCLIRTA